MPVVADGGVAAPPYRVGLTYRSAAGDGWIGDALFEK